MHLVHLEEVRATEALLDTEAALSLPVVVGEGEEDSVGTDLGHDAGKGSSLLSSTGDSHAVGGTGGGPAALQVVSSQARADLTNSPELRLDELTSLGSGGTGVEERLDVGSDDVHDTAKSAAGGLEDVEGLGGGDGTRVTGGSPGSLGRGDEASELLSRAESVEDGLVTDDDHGDGGPVAGRTPGGNVADLLSSTGDTRALNEDTEDDLQAVGLASGTDVLETRAVSSVETDGGEALSLDGGKVGHDITGGLAVSAGGVGSVGDGPLVAVDNGSTTVGSLGRSSNGSRRGPGHSSGLGPSLSGGSGPGLSVGSRSSPDGGSGGGSRDNSAPNTVVGAVDDLVSNGSSYSGCVASVSAGGHGPWDGVDNDSRGGDGGGNGRNDGVDTSRGALVDSAGKNLSGGLVVPSGGRLGHGGLARNSDGGLVGHGGDVAAVGVPARSKRSAGLDDDRVSGGDSDGLLGNSVDTS